MAGLIAWLLALPLAGQVVVVAAHQPKEVLAARLSRVPKHLAIYEITGCSDGPGGSLEMARIRHGFARVGLSIVAPEAVPALAERERRRGIAGALAAIPDALPIAAITLAASGAPTGATIAASAASAALHLARGREHFDARAFQTPAALDVPDGGCAAALVLVRWDGEGRTYEANVPAKKEK